MSSVLVPKHPGALSAYGIFVSDYVRDYSRTVMLGAGDQSLESHLSALEQNGRENLARDGLGHGTGIRSVDIRYAGQGYELTVPWSSRLVDDFHDMHRQRYGYADRKRPVEIVTARVRVITQSGPPPETVPLAAAGDGAETEIFLSDRIYAEHHWHESRSYRRSDLRPGHLVRGPAVITEYSATTYVPPDFRALVDDQANLRLEPLDV